MPSHPTREIWNQWSNVQKQIRRREVGLLLESRFDVVYVSRTEAVVQFADGVPLPVPWWLNLCPDFNVIAWAAHKGFKRRER